MSVDRREPDFNVRAQRLFNNGATLFILFMLIVSVTSFFYSKISNLEGQTKRLIESRQIIDFVCDDLKKDDQLRTELHSAFTQYDFKPGNPYSEFRERWFEQREQQSISREEKCDELKGKSK